jgi:hypothetical protein
MHALGLRLDWLELWSQALDLDLSFFFLFTLNLDLDLL